MIRLTAANIVNFRSCINTRLEMHDTLTALIGINGVGKTNILTTLIILGKLSSYRRLRSPDILKETSVSKVELEFLIDKETYQLSANLYFDLNEASDEVAYAELKIKNRRSRAWSKVENLYLDYLSYAYRNNISLKVDRLAPKDSSPLRHAKNSIIEYISTISYYSATQFSDPTRSPVSVEMQDKRLLRSYSRSKSHEMFIFDLYNAYEKSLAFNQYIDIVGPDGLALVDNITFTEYDLPNSSVKVLHGGHIRKVERHKRVVVPTFHVDELHLSPTQLSEGTFKTLALIFYILNDDSDFLLIEEPEVCVHHGLLSSVVELIKIKSNEKQIIISTHSDYILDMLSPENVVVVTKTKDTGTKALTLDKTLGKTDYAYLKKYLNDSGNLGEYWRESGFLQ